MRNALPIVAIVMALAVCATRQYVLAQDKQPQSSATKLLDQSAINRAEDPAAACVQALTAAEEGFQSKLDALSEADADKLNQLLDDADASCTEGNFTLARQKLETVNDMVAKAK